MFHILIVEDDCALAEGLCRALASDACSCVCCGSLQQARDALGADISLILLDVNLPDGSGLDFLRELKQSFPRPVILLTANDMEIDVVTGLELGADDYITKPFSLAVLRARVNTQLRRLEQQPTAHIVHCGEYLFDFDHMEFFVQGSAIELSKTEQKLLRLLVENSGITLSRGQLIDRIWTDGAEYVDENTLSVCVKRLRDKLHASHCIKTVYGIGYVWRPPYDV